MCHFTFFLSKSVADNIWRVADNSVPTYQTGYP